MDDDRRLQKGMMTIMWLGKDDRLQITNNEVEDRFQVHEDYQVD